MFLKKKFSAKEQNLTVKFNVCNSKYMINLNLKLFTFEYF